ncbi:MAG: UPF0175 family protein [Magnetococcales bacterium]|nr:UPF0175 family protein [Nitrospirota bacterium]
MGRELVLKWVVPDTVDKQLEDEIVRSAKEEVVVRLFKESEISSGYAAKLLGLAKRDFMELLNKKGVPFFYYSDEAWEKELRTVEELKKEIENNTHQ